MSGPRILAGTSGFAYKPWKGRFYPADLKDTRMLGYYAARLPAVEINNTFYRMPKRSVLEGWAAEVPEGFRFVIKASRRITHMARLKDCAEPLRFLLTNVQALGGRLGPLLFQLPPNLRPDPARLEGFLATLAQVRDEVGAGPVRLAFEFRSAGWFEEPVYALLKAHGAALVTADQGEGEDATPFVPTAPFGYLRLRREVYSDDELRSWSERIAAQPWDDAYVFFKDKKGELIQQVQRLFHPAP